MNIKQVVFLIGFFWIIPLITGCIENVNKGKRGSRTYSQEERLPVDVRILDSGVGVALADMNADSYLDIISASPDGVKFFENRDNGTFVDHGVIASTDVRYLDSGVGIAIGDVDVDGVLDIVISAPDGIKIIRNPVPPKK